MKKGRAQWMKRGGPRLDGDVTVRRFVAPQLRTTASIRCGELVEPLEEIARRVCVDPASVEGLVDAHGIALFDKLHHGTEVFLSGAVAESSENNGQSSDGARNGGEVFSPQPPDASVAWAYDPRMLLHVPPVDRIPETPYRLQRAIEFLKSTPRARELLPEELLHPEKEKEEDEGGVKVTRAPENDGGSNNGKTLSNVAPLSYWIPPRLATLEEITLCHDESRYHDFVQHGTALPPPLKTDVYCSDTASSVATRLAVGAVIDAARCALSGAPTLAFCLVRPPGHHCTIDTPGGFCLANNVAIAARQLQKDSPNNNNNNSDSTTTTTTNKVPPPRIAIVDLDVHHGEGTQSFVEEEGPSPLTALSGEVPVSPLLYLSLHRYDHGTFYPFDPRGDTAYVGRYRNICNVAINTAANDPVRCEEVISDTVFERVMDDIFIPRLQRFSPDVVLVSLGFDAAYGDPLGRMAVEGGFAYAVRALKQFCLSQQRQEQYYKHPPTHAAQLCDPHVGLVVVLEGGYSPEAVAQGVVAVAHALRYPANDADVVRYAARKIPRTWQDLRRRIARQHQEVKRQREELRAKEKTDLSCEMASVSPTHGPEEEEEVPLLPEDDVLLERHERWCDRLISRVLAIHTEAN